MNDIYNPLVGMEQFPSFPDHEIAGQRIRIPDELMGYRDMVAYIQAQRISLEYMYGHIMYDPKKRNYRNISALIVMANRELIPAMKQYIENALTSFPHYTGKIKPTDEEYGICTDLDKYKIYEKYRSKYMTLDYLDIDSCYENGYKPIEVSSEGFLQDIVVDYDLGFDVAAGLGLFVILFNIIKFIILFIPNTIKFIAACIRKFRKKRAIKWIEKAKNVQLLNDTVTKIFDSMEFFIAYAAEEFCYNLPHRYVKEQKKADERLQKIKEEKNPLPELIQSIELWPYHPKTISLLLDQTISHHDYIQGIFTFAWTMCHPVYESWVSTHYKIYNKQRTQLSELVLNKEKTFENAVCMRIVDNNGVCCPCTTAITYICAVELSWKQIYQEIKTVYGSYNYSFEYLDPELRIELYPKLLDILGRYGLISDHSFTPAIFLNNTFIDNTNISSARELVKHIKDCFDSDRLFHSIRYETVEDLFSAKAAFDADVNYLDSIKEKYSISKPTSQIFYSSVLLEDILNRLVQIPDDKSHLLGDYIKGLYIRLDQLRSYETCPEYRTEQELLNGLQSMDIQWLEKIGSDNYSDFLEKAEKLLSILGNHCIYQGDGHLVRPLAIIWECTDEKFENPDTYDAIVICSDAICDIKHNYDGTLDASRSRIIPYKSIKSIAIKKHILSNKGLVIQYEYKEAFSLNYELSFRDGQGAEAIQRLLEKSRI